MMGTFFVLNIINTIIYIGTNFLGPCNSFIHKSKSPCPAAVRAKLGKGDLWTLWVKRSGQLPSSFLSTASKFTGGAFFPPHKLRPSGCESDAMQNSQHSKTLKRNTDKTFEGLSCFRILLFSLVFCLQLSRQCPARMPGIVNDVLCLHVKPEWPFYMK